MALHAAGSSELTRKNGVYIDLDRCRQYMQNVLYELRVQQICSTVYTRPARRYCELDSWRLLKFRLRCNLHSALETIDYYWFTASTSFSSCSSSSWWFTVNTTTLRLMAYGRSDATKLHLITHVNSMKVLLSCFVISYYHYAY